MGTGRTQSKARAHAKKKCYKRGHSTKCRSRDIDQIQDDIKKEQLLGNATLFERDEDLPGLGQFYCTPCARHFIDNYTKEAHLRSKLHKRRLKDIGQKQYTQEEADKASGKTKEKLLPAHQMAY